jgi:hypothetical protein
MYTSIQDYKNSNPTHVYFAHAMQENPNSEWMVAYGDPLDTEGKFLSSKWSIISLMISDYREAEKLAQKLNDYEHNLSVGQNVIYRSDTRQAKFFNGEEATVYKIENGIINVQFHKDIVLLPANKRMNVLPIYLAPTERKHQNA